MKFRRTKVEHLAEHLRAGIQRREIVSPLPSTREWCESLGVSRNTLKKALKILQGERLLQIEPRKSIRLLQKYPSKRKISVNTKKSVRLIYYRLDYPQRSLIDFYPELADHLHAHHVDISMEGCTHARIREISRQSRKANELLLLASLPSAWYNYFEPKPRGVAILGYPNRDSRLPHIVADLKGCVRQATNLLLQWGFSKISFLVNRSFSQGLADVGKIFTQTCQEWPNQPVRADIVKMRLEFRDHRMACRRFAARITSPHGILILHPVSLSMVMTALLERGVRVPDRACVVSLMTTPECIKVCPTPAHYFFPQRAFVKQLTEMALHYFETGTLPIFRVIPVKLASPV